MRNMGGGNLGKIWKIIKKKQRILKKWQKGGTRKMQGKYMQNMGTTWKIEKFESHNIHRNVWKHMVPIPPPLPAPQFTFYNKVVRVVEY